MGLPIRLLVAMAAASALAVMPPIHALVVREPAVYMAYHYAAYGAGFMLGPRQIGGYMRYACLGVATSIAVMWHTPWLFALGASNEVARVLDGFSNVIGGWCARVFVSSVGLAGRLVLLALYMAGDSYLAAVFYGGGYAYSYHSIDYSPYPPNAFYLASILMFAMSAIVFVAGLTSIIKKLAELSEPEAQS